jgi:hypothetical protein
MGIFKPRRPGDPEPFAVQKAKAMEPDPRPVREERIESAIDRAMRLGAFDDLPGKGRPLPEDYLRADAEYLGWKIARDQGYVPEWVELARAVDELDAMLDGKRETPKEGRAALVARRNALVRRLNQKVPSPYLQKGLRDASTDEFPVDTNR